MSFIFRLRAKCHVFLASQCSALEFLCDVRLGLHSDTKNNRFARETVCGIIVTSKQNNCEGILRGRAVPLSGLDEYVYPGVNGVPTQKMYNILFFTYFKIQHSIS
jgi:hypothetical protein